MTQPIDEVFVEIEPDTRNFDRKLKQDTEAAYDRLQKSTDRVVKKITKSFDSAGREIERTFTSIERDGVVTTKVIEKAFDDAGDRIEKSFKLVSEAGVEAEELIAAVAKSAADSTADSFERAGERIEDAFREANRVALIKSKEIAHHAEQAADKIDSNAGLLNRSFSKVFETVVSLGSALVGLGAAAPTPAGLIAILATITAIGAAIGPVIALTGALADLVGLIGLIPAAGAAGAASIVAVTLAFQGFGDAIDAILKKDPEKIAEALKKLSPAARNVARDIQRALPAFERFQKSIQQAFFAPFVNTVEKLVKNLLPSLQSGLSKVAGAAGRQLNNLFDLFNQPDNIAVFNRIFATTAKIIDTIGPSIARVADSFIHLADAGLPFLETFSGKIADAGNKFAKFIENAIESGSFDEFVSDAVDTLKELVDLGKALGDLFVAMFANADDEGRDFIQVLTDAVQNLADFFKTAEGQESLQKFVDTVKQTGLAILAVVEVIQFLLSWNNAFINMWSDIIDAVKDAGIAIGSFFSDLWGDITDFFGDVVDFVSGVPDKIITFLSSLPGKISDFFKGVFDAALHAIGVGIGIVLFVITQLPGLIIDKIKALPGQIAEFFTNLWNTARDRTVEGGNKIVTWVQGLPGRIKSLLQSIGPTIANIFKSALESAKNFVVNGFNSIVNFISGVPNRIKNAFKATGGFLSDIAGSIAGAIKGFLNKAIDKINSGIADVDNVLPGSLPRIPRLAKGGVIDPRPGGTLAVLAEAGDREIATPEKLLRQILAEERGPGIVFEPGSVVVEFHGAAPSEAEAFRTGQAVGMGISDSLARRNVRTKVRAL